MAVSFPKTSQWMIDWGLVGESLAMWQRKTSQNFSNVPADQYPLLWETIGSVSQADGPLTQQEQNKLEFLMSSCPAADTSRNKMSQKQLLARWDMCTENSIPLTTRKFCLLAALFVAAADGLSQVEWDFASTLCARMRLSDYALPDALSIIKAENDLFRKYHQVFRPGMDGEYGMKPISETALLSAEQTVPRWLSDFDLFGESFMIWMTNTGGIGDTAELWTNAREPIHNSRMNEYYWRMAAAVAKADGVLSDREKEKYISIIKDHWPDEPWQEWIQSNTDELPRLMDLYQKSGEVVKKLFMTKFKISRTESNVSALTGFLHIFDDFLNTCVKLCLMTSVVVAAADGLKPAEMNRVYQIAEKLGQTREVAQKMGEVAFYDKLLWEKYYLFFGGDLGFRASKL